ncbi:MAG: hypothetical protein MAG581_00670 [Deltaproteobacteria bacterium]|jgi:polyisoprenoid-binding protein YceI|nr:hypothetical protein [Deltaproteobacteria bacterium]
MNRVIKTFIINILLILSAQTLFAEEHVFAPDEHCLAYKTEKSVLFVADVEVIGKSCEVTAKMNWNHSGEKAQVKVSVPVISLDSNNAFRDEDIPEILRVDQTYDIRFISDWLEIEVLKKMLQEKKGEVSGILEVAGGKFPVKFMMTFTSKPEYYLVTGHLNTTFAALNVDVPDVAWGLVAQPKEFLELLVHLRSDKISGAERLAIQQ